MTRTRKPKPSDEPTTARRITLSAEMQKRLSDAHEHLLTASNILKELHGGLAGAHVAADLNAITKQRSGSRLVYTDGQWWKCTDDPVYGTYCVPADPSEIPSGGGPGV